MAPCACSCCDHGHCSAVIAQTLIKCSTYACTKGLRTVVCCSARIRTKPRQALEQASRQGSGCVCVQVFQKVQQSMDIKSSSQVHRRERCAERHGAQAAGSSGSLPARVMVMDDGFMAATSPTERSSCNRVLRQVQCPHDSRPTSLPVRCSLVCLH